MEPPPPPRWIVGIDLGTTNSAVAYVDSALQSPVVRSFLIEQLTDWNTTEKKKTLPSFHYVPTCEEANSCSSKWLPKAGKSLFIVGSAARDVGGNSPDRQIASAKSWLCHRTADRTAPILPWHGDPEIELISPVVASSRYLEHIRIAWDAAHPEHPLESCEVVLTLPASFDEVARELTLQAAKMAGLQKVILIEEPQAAFYAWLETQKADSQADSWQETIKPGNTVLVCDIGGGTTDFTLIRVKAETSPTESLQKYGLHRVAVGQHLLLGGDNLDVALSKVVEPMLTGSDTQTLPIRQWEQLRHQCRLLKERLLQSDAPESSSVAIIGSGSRLISNTKSAKIEKLIVERTVLEGFFPIVKISDKPQQLDSGLIEFGLTYATEPAITKHLAAFLWEHRWDGREDTDKQSISDLQAAKPDWLLFNGGVLESSLIRKRLEDQVNAWFPEEKPVGILPAERLDLAVSIGAAYFGLAKRGIGVRITANLARSYYLKISETPPRVVCVMSANAKPLDNFQLKDCPLTLTVGQPIQLPIFISNTNLIHRVGDIVDVEPTNMLPLAPLATVLHSEKSRKTREIPVVIESSLSEIGTLELALVESQSEQVSAVPARWKLAFDLRGTSINESRNQTTEIFQHAIIDQATISQIVSIVKQVFAADSSSLSKTFMKQIADVLDQPREKWSLSVLRAIWQACLECDQDRKRSPAIESRWLNTIGFCLRPGYGFVSDDWRVAQTWRAVRGKLRYPSSAAEAMILWRRVSGGFTQGQQQAIYQEMQTNLRGILSGEASKIRLVSDPEEFLRMVGSLELLPSVEKTSIGRLAIDSLDNPKLKSLQEGILWMIGRIGSRSLVYAPVNRVLSAETAEQWLARLMRISDLPILALQRAVFSLARKTNDRYRDISREQQTKVSDWLSQASAPMTYVELVQSVGNLAASEQEAFAGDSLPLGVRLNDSTK
ncbi:MAG: Hsp70 family protein [Planctomycetota bacterium]|nr:Hsp70 family protein [Planctomycetota bacterium]